MHAHRSGFDLWVNIYADQKECLIPGLNIQLVGAKQITDVIEQVVEIRKVAKISFPDYHINNPY